MTNETIGHDHPAPASMATLAYPDGTRCEAVPLDVKRTYYAAGVEAERARLAAILRDLDKGDWLPGRLRKLVAALTQCPACKYLAWMGGSEGAPSIDMPAHTCGRRGRRPWGGDYVRDLSARPARLSEAKIEALSKALLHGFVEIGKGYGRDGLYGVDTSTVVAAGTWKSLVLGRLLTPHDDGKPFSGEALRVEVGRRAYLTREGRARAETIVERRTL